MLSEHFCCFLWMLICLFVLQFMYFTDGILHLHFVMPFFWWETQDAGHLATKSRPTTCIPSIMLVTFGPKACFKERWLHLTGYIGHTSLPCFEASLLISSLLLSLSTVWVTKMANELILCTGRICQAATNVPFKSRKHISNKHTSLHSDPY